MIGKKAGNKATANSHYNHSYSNPNRNVSPMVFVVKDTTIGNKQAHSADYDLKDRNDQFAAHFSEQTELEIQLKAKI
jgi:hypothetical protein